jgi:hypothetical protein
LKLKYDEISELCLNASSGTPVFCYESLTQKDRKAIGMTLCSQASSPLPSTCWNQLIALKGVNKLSSEVILSFCQTITDTAPLLCLDFVHSHGLTGAGSGSGNGGSGNGGNSLLTACQSAIYSLDSHENIDSSINCFHDLKKEIQPSRGLTTADIISFCFTQLYPHNASQICYLQTGQTHSNTQNQCHSLSLKQRLELCQNAVEIPSPRVTEKEQSEKKQKMKERKKVDQEEEVEAEEEEEVEEISPSILCYEHLYLLKKQNKISSSIKEEAMIEICSGVKGLGPADCYAAAKQIQFSSSESGTSGGGGGGGRGVGEKSKIQKNMEKVKAMRASASGKVTIKEEPSFSLEESSSIPLSSLLPSPEEINHQGKLLLCENAPNDGPARCVKRALAVFQNIRQQSSSFDSPNPEIAVPPGYDPTTYFATLLCTGASSDGPAECVNKAPHWLSPEEKIHLCSYSEIISSTTSLSSTSLRSSRSYVPNHPLDCLTAVSNSISSKRLTNSPKKCFGYFASSLSLESERKSRALLLHMCSYHGSDYPLAAAYCYRTVPTILDHDTAVMSVCTNHTNMLSDQDANPPSSSPTSSFSSSPTPPALRYDPEALSSCSKLLPANWKSEERTLLCAHVNSMKAAEAVVGCALDLHFQTKLLTRLEAATLCSNETVEKEKLTKGGKNSPHSVGGIASCIRHIHSDIPSGGSLSNLPSKEIQMRVCGVAKTGAAGSCLAYFSQKNKILWFHSTEELVQFCSSITTGDGDGSTTTTVPPLTRVSCLQHLYQNKYKSKAGSITSEDISYCLEVDPYPEKATVISFYGSTGGGAGGGDEIRSSEAIAGRWFRLEFQLWNQWGQKMNGVNDVRVLVTINVNNPQGAVLWGTTSNSSLDGRVAFDHLIVSQPGTVELKVLTVQAKEATPSSSPSTAPSRSSFSKGQRVPYHIPTLLLTRLIVQPNPELIASQNCLFVFTSLTCPVPSESTGTADRTQWEYTFPNEIGFLSSNYYLLMLSCSSVFDLWAVLSSPLPSGVTYVQYRYGIDSIWTGNGLPREEMSFHERLDLSETTTDLKEIRRAYHRKSLQWHPDRWSGLMNTLPGTGGGKSLSSELYGIAVQGAFELIAEAYQVLTSIAGLEEGSK